MATIGESAGISLGQIATGAIVVTAAIDGLIQGTEKFDNALENGITSADGMLDAMVGMGTIINPVGARLAESMSKAQLEALGLDEGLANIGSRMAEFAVAGSWIPVLGTGLGAVAGAAFGLAENLGMIGHGTSGLENYSDRLQDIVDGTDDAAGAVSELRWLMMGEKYMDAGAGGYLSGVLEKSYEEKEEWFKSYVEDLGIYSDEQMNEIRDMMGLYETEAERVAGSIRAMKEVALSSMMQLNEGMFDADYGEWVQPFSDAYDAAVETGANFRDLYKAELEAQTGALDMSVEQIARAMDDFDNARNEGRFENIGLDVGQTGEEGTQEASLMDNYKVAVDEFVKAGMTMTDAMGAGTDEMRKLTIGEREQSGAIQQTISDILGLGDASLLTEDGFNKLLAESDSFANVMGGFTFDEYMDELDWYEFIRSVDLNNFVTRVDTQGGETFNDFISRPGRGVVGFSPNDTIIGMKRPGDLNIAGSGGGGGITIQKVTMTFNGDIRTDADYEEIEQRMTDSLNNALKGVS
jgi:hypothetical protein